MSACSDLQVDVNGEAIFMVDKNVLSFYSGRLSKLLGKSTSTKRNLKIIFHDFPGGAATFELIARFCYNNGNIDIIPTNLTLLHSAAQFMEMTKPVSGSENLVKQTERTQEEISSWTWSDLLVALKQTQETPQSVDSSNVVQNCLDTLVGRLTLACETSPCPSTSSPDSSVFRISCDSRSTESLKTSCSRAWWFEDLISFDHNLIERVIKSMVSRKLDHNLISKFLFYYQKTKFLHAKTDEKCNIMEMLINVLHLLDQCSVPYRCLFGILRLSLNLNISKCSRSKLESMIGARIDEATLDNVLVPSLCGVNCLYDVNLVLRFLKYFSSGGHNKICADRLSRAADLMDLYLAEVAPDPCLKPSKFIALATALPDYARDSFDEVYHAIDMYLEVHTEISEEETFKICCALNYEKLSPEACVHLSQNEKFPSRSAVQALYSQQTKLKTLLEHTNYSSSPENGAKGKRDEFDKQIVLYAGKVDVVTENKKIKAHLQGMQSRVTELEKICRKMQTQMSKIMKSKSPSHKSLPKMCS